MAIKTLFEEEGNSSSQLPLVRQYCKEQVKEGNEPYDVPLELRYIAISKNGEWIRAETDVCLALIPSGSTIGKGLLDVMPNLSGEGNALVLIPKKSGKLGFSIGVDEEEKAYYNWHKEDEYLTIARSKVKKVTEEYFLKVTDIIPPLPNHPSRTEDAVKEGIKAAEKRARNGTAKVPRTSETPK